MITFDLCCHREHRFEGWFRNREDFEDQLAGGLLQCPLCGSTRITRKPSAVAVHVSRRTGPPQPLPDRAGDRPGNVGEGEAEGKAVRAESFLRALARFVEDGFEDVGTRFADEARKIHQGEAEARNIRGTTTGAEEEALREEGVAFLKIPVPKFDA